jgi:hypothetical protein
MIRRTAAALLACLASIAGAQELAVSEPRLVLAPGQRLDGALASDGKSNIAAWTDRRTVSAIFASRVRNDGTVLDPYGIRIAPPAGDYVDQAVAAIGDTTMVVAMRAWGQGVDRIAVARVGIDGTLLDPEAKIAGIGQHPAIASNGATFLLASALAGDVDLLLFSADLEVLARTRVHGGFPRVAANGERYLCTFIDGTVARGVIIEHGVAGEPFDIATTSQPAVVTSAGDSWAVAFAYTTIQVCAVSAEKNVACRGIAQTETPSFVSDVVSTGDALIVAWSSEAPIRRTLVPPPIAYDFHLTRVTRDAAIELNTTPGAPPADDDVLMFRDAGEAMRVGRTGVVTLIPIALGAPAQTLYAMLPSGDAAIAFWGELTPRNDAYELHATRFTSDGWDPSFRDRVFGTRVQPLASDGTNILLDDGRLIGPAGAVLAHVELPSETELAAWDGKRWLFVAKQVLHRGNEALPVRAGYPRRLACTRGACVLGWVDASNMDHINIAALHVRADRPLSRAKTTIVAKDAGYYQTIGVAAAGDALLVAWPDTTRMIRGRLFGARGPAGATIPIAPAVHERDPLFFEAGSANGAFVLVQNAWPQMRVVRLTPAGALIDTAELRNGTARGLGGSNGRTLLFYERAAPEPPYASTNRAFVTFAPHDGSHTAGSAAAPQSDRENAPHPSAHRQCPLSRRAFLPRRQPRAGRDRGLVAAAALRPPQMGDGDAAGGALCRRDRMDPHGDGHCGRAAGDRRSHGAHVRHPRRGGALHPPFRAAAAQNSRVNVRFRRNVNKSLRRTGATNLQPTANRCSSRAEVSDATRCSDCHRFSPPHPSRCGDRARAVLRAQ